MRQSRSPRHRAHLVRSRFEVPDPVATNDGGPPAMNLMQKFEALGRKQLALQEGIQLLQDAQFDLRKARGAADAWGITAVMANVTLVPLNCIVNAFELKAANSAYQAMVHALYKK